MILHKIVLVVHLAFFFFISLTHAQTYPNQNTINISRYPKIESPVVVHAGQEIEFKISLTKSLETTSVEIDSVNTELVKISHDKQINMMLPNQEKWKIYVTILAPFFEPVGNFTGRLELNRTGLSIPLNFKLKAKIFNGDARISNVQVKLRYNGIFLLSYSKQIKIVKQDSRNVALLVGINKYSNLPETSQLRGCVNDVLLMNKLLSEVFQFDTSNIKILTDKQATRKNILTNFNHFLINNATRDGQAVFYYSGHGSKMTDLNGDEPDGFDETIISCDSRDIRGLVKDISDDTLRELLDRLTNKCKNVTIIFDCCHSGSGMRGDIARAKQIPALELEDTNVRSIKMSRDGPAGFLPPDPNYVMISACQDREVAREIDGHGLLTFTLNKVIRKYPKASYREIMYHVSEKVNLLNANQHPQLEGKRRDTSIFGKIGIKKSFAEVLQVQRNKVQLNVGLAHSVTKGSIYALFKPRVTTDRNMKHYLGKARIIEVNPFTSWATIEERKNKIVKNSAAFEFAHHYGDLQLAVCLALKDNPVVYSQIETLLEEYKKNEGLIRIVALNERFDLRFRYDKNNIIIERPDYTQLWKADKNLKIIKFELRNILTKEARRLNLYQLENDRSNLNVSMVLERWEQFGNKYYPAKESLFKVTAGGQKYLSVGDIIKVKITNRSTIPAYPYLFDLGSDGSVTLLYPGIGSKENPLNPGRSYESDLIKISPPEGLNGLKLIATTVATDFSTLTQDGFRGIDELRSSDKGINSPLGKLLNMAWGGSRNLETIKPIKMEDWATEMTSFFIIDK
jgi:hypothetical protein